MLDQGSTRDEDPSSLELITSHRRMPLWLMRPNMAMSTVATMYQPVPVTPSRDLEPASDPSVASSGRPECFDCRLVLPTTEP